MTAQRSWAGRMLVALLAVACALLALAGVVSRAPAARAAVCTDPDPIARHYCELGGTASVLGTPVGPARDIPGGRVQDYTQGSMYWSASTGAHEVHGAIGAHYLELGGPGGNATVVLGFPTTDETVTPDGVGRFNHFQGGSIYWTPSTGAHEVHGAIREKWAAMGWERSLLGYPLTDETAAVGGRYNDFQGGSIYWSPSTGAHEVHGSIGLRYRQLGGPAGTAAVVLGFPTTDETVTPDGVGRFNHFQGGSIYWTPSTGAHEVHGAIREKWAAMGWERSLLGYPLTDETAAVGGRYNDFQGGSIYWSPSTGAHEVHGSIGLRYRQLGGPAGTAAVVLGFPTTDETTTPDGVGRYNHFQGGSIYWTPSTGAHEVHGAIREKWAALGWERSVLGYPVTDETTTPDGVGRYNHFQGGSIYWTPSTGAHEVHGSIREKWAALGWERSPLGYPITDEYAVNGGRQSDFQGGFLRWTAATGVVDVAVLDPYTRAGTWVTRYRFSHEYGGANPLTTPAQVDTMADSGVHTIYLQAAADDPTYPGLLSPDLLGQFLDRAHARGLRVVAWYLPHFTDVTADLARLQAMIAFRSPGGQAFDAVAVDIEDRSVTDVDARNAALVDLSTRLHAAAPGTTLGAIVLPPVVTDVISPTYWPRFPWHQLSGLYQVWLPMAYWTNRTDPVYSDPATYVTENITRLRGDLGEQCAAVSVIGGYGAGVPSSAYAAMATAAAQQGAVGVSIFDWATTPAASWGPVRGYAVRGC